MSGQLSIKDVFVQCQTGMQCHGKMTKALLKTYNKLDYDTFWSQFSHYLKYAMIVFKREPAVERLIDFVAKFIPAAGKKEKEAGGGDAQKEGEATTEDGQENKYPQDEDEVEENKLLQDMFDFLLQSHSAKDRAVRFRCCQLVNKLLHNLGEDAQIDDDLYDKIYECMLERLKDKCPLIRYHAVLAMSRLQDPTDENCPVIKAYLFLLNCDPNPDVRRAVLTCIAPSTKTLSSIIGRTRDVKDTVRKAAYQVVSEKVHVKALSIALRLQLMQDGLNDRAEGVRETCSSKLLQAWLRTFGGNVLELLKSLDAEDSTDICALVLETLFKSTSTEELVGNFDILDDRLLIPLEKLTSESALYWQSVCKFLYSMGPDGEVHLEKVLPTCVDFCSYLKSYVDELQGCDDAEQQLMREFIIKQLLLIAGFMDLADIASRKALENLLHHMLLADHVSNRIVKAVIDRVCAIQDRSESMVSYFAETVSDIREPITLIEKGINPDEKRQVDIKVAGIRVKLNQLREDLDDCVRDQNFSRAAEIKEEVAKLETERSELIESSQPETEEVRTEKNDPQTILKCQTIIAEMLQLLKLSGSNPTVQMLLESQIVPGVQNEDPDVRNIAMRALGLCCYLCKDQVATFMPLFMQASQIDVEGVRITALKVMFDLLHTYGLDIVDIGDDQAADLSANVSGNLDNTMATSGDQTQEDIRNGTASKLVAIVCSFLDSESSELRTVAAEGLAKLLLSGRVVSSKILSHLILLWYNPVTEDDTYLRDCLGTFFPIYALAGRANQDMVVEAFLPTLKTLLNAPHSSPLAEVDVNNVAELLVQLTNAKLLAENQNATDSLNLDNPGHDDIAMKVCNEIISNSSSSHLKLWVRILNQLELSPDNDVALKDLNILCERMMDLVKEKLCQKPLQKFQAYIKKLVENCPSLANQPEHTADTTTTTVLETTAVEETSLMKKPEDLGTPTCPKTGKRKRTRGLYSESNVSANLTTMNMEITLDATIEETTMAGLNDVPATPPRQRRPSNRSLLSESSIDPSTVYQTTIAKAQLERSQSDKSPNVLEVSKDSDQTKGEESADEGLSRIDEKDFLDQISDKTGSKTEESPETIKESSQSDSQPETIKESSQSDSQPETVKESSQSDSQPETVKESSVNGSQESIQTGVVTDSQENVGRSQTMEMSSQDEANTSSQDLFESDSQCSKGDNTEESSQQSERVKSPLEEISQDKNTEVDDKETPAKRSTRSRATRSATKTATKNASKAEKTKGGQEDSDLENNVFTSPTPGRAPRSTRSTRSKPSEASDLPKKNLDEELAMEDNSSQGDTTRRSTRRSGALAPTATSAKEKTPAKQKAASSKESTPGKRTVASSKEKTPVKQTVASSKEKTPAKQTVASSKEKTPAKQTVESSKEKTPAKQTVASLKEKTPAKQTVASSKEKTPVKQAVASSKEKMPAKQMEASTKENFPTKQKAASIKETSQTKEKVASLKEMSSTKQKAASTKGTSPTKQKTASANKSGKEESSSQNEGTRRSTRHSGAVAPAVTTTKGKTKETVTATAATTKTTRSGRALRSNQKS